MAAWTFTVPASFDAKKYLEGAWGILKLTTRIITAIATMTTDRRGLPQRNGKSRTVAP